jgi:hypothetical protein
MMDLKENSRLKEGEQNDTLGSLYSGWKECLDVKLEAKAVGSI